MSNPSLLLKENKEKRNKYFDSVNKFRERVCIHDNENHNYVPISKKVFDDYLKWNATGMLNYHIINDAKEYTLKDVVDFIRIMDIDDSYDIYIAAMFHRANKKEDIDISSFKDAYDVCSTKKFKYLYWIMKKYIFDQNIVL